MKRLLFFAGIALAAIALLFWGFSKPGSPRYKDKTVKDWFFQYYSTGNYGNYAPEDHEEAKIALTVLVTNSVPFLIHEARHPRRDTILTRFGHEVGRIFARGKTGRYITGTNIASEAEFAVKYVQPPATVLMPLLTNWLNGPKDNKNYTAAVFYLGCMGEGAEVALPYLSDALTNSATSLWARNLAAQSLQWLGPKSKAALPALIESLSRTNTPANVYKLLGQIGSDAKEALPLLDKKLAANTGKRFRNYIAGAICSIDPTRADALEILGELLKPGHSADERRDTMYVLRGIGPSAKNVVPLLLEISREADDSIVTTALDTLQSISPDDARQALREKMKGENPSKAIWAAGWLLRMDSKNAEALTLLTNYFSAPNHDPMWDNYALEQLGEASSDEKNVSVFLQKFLKSPNDQLRRTAEQSLKKIRLKDEIQKIKMEKKIAE